MRLFFEGNGGASALGRTVESIITRCIWAFLGFSIYNSFCEDQSPAMYFRHTAISQHFQVVDHLYTLTCSQAPSILHIECILQTSPRTLRQPFVTSTAHWCPPRSFSVLKKEFHGQVNTTGLSRCSLMSPRFIWYFLQVFLRFVFPTAGC